MFVLPVIDLQRGVAVHGRAGRRAEYRAVESVLAPSADPIELGRGIVHRLGLDQIYVADLHAIAGGRPNWPVHRALLDLGLRLWLDAGLAHDAQIDELLERLGDRVTVVIGLETLVAAADFTSMLARYGADRLVVSFDLDDGVPRTRIAEWQCDDALTVAQRLMQLGARRMILLDLRRVGMSDGTGTERLLSQLRRIDSELELVCGGGIRDLQSIQSLAAHGCNGVLLATALHEGRIGRSEIERVRRIPPPPRSAGRG